jgi:hypothetical protein
MKGKVRLGQATIIILVCINEFKGGIIDFYLVLNNYLARVSNVFLDGDCSFELITIHLQSVLSSYTQHYVINIAQISDCQYIKITFKTFLTFTQHIIYKE